ncbi:protein DCL, chloroplastic-like isoform X2 [Neltuma alba]|uniref:protein DCL, chloroplastic-like isoform X2 n=1 Tax=Neltuma alba TaxID=207710 RepID=UPI0010A2FF37|nr:protein DCL, chloroplastic-like isoform X2 [Prosopis alba]XP_028785985.1 protein DCL, chloroplastic-like isoform X2 [Prosopis alba]
MASLTNLPPHTHPRTNPVSFHFSPAVPSFRFRRNVSLLHTRLCALNTGSDADNLLRKPVVSPGKDISEILEEDQDSGVKRAFDDVSEHERWVDWEDQILEDTVPLVGFVRMILHSGKYESGDRLIPEHENTILEKLLPFHPEFEKKKGCGIDYITVGYHPNFERSRCLFIVRKDGELVDFSYWKCIKGLIRKNYPLYADSFILRHFRRRRRNF